jgi:predicted nuclease of predicted toxin-antitoxin system
MKIVADESVDQRIIDRVRLAGHEVVSIADAAPGVADEWVLKHASGMDTLLLTADKDFGELVYRQRLAHCGVILLRQAGLSISARCDAVVSVLGSHANELATAFTVIAPDSVRIRRPPHAEA